MLVVAQIAIAMVLVCGAAVLIRSFVAALRVDPGVRVEGILTAGVTLNDRLYDDEQQRRFFDEATRALSGVPGTTGVADEPSLGVAEKALPCLSITAT